MRLLVVEDEVQFAQHLVRGLREEAYAVDLATTLGEASEQVFVTDYDLVILDLMLPDGSGLGLLGELRDQENGVPVLILTARDSVADKVEGLNHGADDYLTKPFAFEELLARARTLLRRRDAKPLDRIRFADLKLDRTQQRAGANGMGS